uniref:Uncharacterized protein n=1 Tax=Anguilla anguilla TaxID=7936 RepID=A0A0E9VHI7_ANGAN
MYDFAKPAIMNCCRSPLRPAALCGESIGHHNAHNLACHRHTT